MYIKTAKNVPQSIKSENIAQYNASGKCFTIKYEVFELILPLHLCICRILLLKMFKIS